jgi:hypothetical protein
MGSLTGVSMVTFFIIKISCKSFMLKTDFQIEQRDERGLGFFGRP